MARSILYQYILKSRDQREIEAHIKSRRQMYGPRGVKWDFYGTNANVLIVIYDDEMAFHAKLASL